MTGVTCYGCGAKDTVQERQYRNGVVKAYCASCASGTDPYCANDPDGRALLAADGA